MLGEDETFFPTKTQIADSFQNKILGRCKSSFLTREVKILGRSRELSSCSCFTQEMAFTPPLFAVDRCPENPAFSRALYMMSPLAMLQKGTPGRDGR